MSQTQTLESYYQEAFRDFKQTAKEQFRGFYQDCLEGILFLGVNDRKLMLSIQNSRMYDTLQRQYKGLFDQLIKRFFISLDGASFIIGLKERPKIIRAHSAKRLDDYLKANEIFKGKYFINSGTAHTGGELFGLMCSLYAKGDKSVEVAYMDVEGKKQLVFKFKTSYSGFAAARSPTIRDPGTVKEHIRRLLQIGVLIQMADGGTQRRAKCVWLYFNPELIEYNYG